LFVVCSLLYQLKQTRAYHSASITPPQSFTKQPQFILQQQRYRALHPIRRIHYTPSPLHALLSFNMDTQDFRPLSYGPNGNTILRLLMVGDSNAGKTSLVLRFDSNVFTSRFSTTIGVDYRDKKLLLPLSPTPSSSTSPGSVPVRLQIWDTAGQERFRSLTSNFFGRADGFMLTYSLSDRHSFQQIKGWITDIRERAPPGVSVILIGNKADLRDEERCVTYAEGCEMADQLGVPFYEVSAKSGVNVEKAFLTLSRTIVERRMNANNGQRGSGGRVSSSSSTSTAHSGGVFTFTEEGHSDYSGGSGQQRGGRRGGGLKVTDHEERSDSESTCCI
jgi:Ras-related protein Rab-8A